MRGDQHVPMNPARISQLRSRVPVIGAMVLVAVVFVLAHPVGGMKSACPAFDAAHGGHAGHDGLLVGATGAHQLVVYDVVDGRPLQRIPVAGVLDQAGALFLPAQRLSVADDRLQHQRKSPGGPDTVAARP